MRKDTLRRLKGLEQRAKVNRPKGPDRIEVYGCVPDENDGNPKQVGGPLILEVKDNGSR